MKTGRPVVQRSGESLARDITAMRRLRESLARNEVLTEAAKRVVVASLDKAIRNVLALASELIAINGERPLLRKRKRSL